METYYTFKNTRAFQSFLRRGNWKEGELDYVTIGEKVYTMHEYDMDGTNMSWGNKKHDTLIECNTANRYESWKDAKVYRFTKYGLLRDDIMYAE